MAPREGSTSRHRESGTHDERRNAHRKKKSRDHGSRRPESGAEDSGPRAAKGPLSLDALAQLNDYNAHHPAPSEEPRDPNKRRRKRRPKPPPEEDYIVVEEDAPSVRRERRRRHESGDEDREARRARRRREAQTDDERGESSRRKERRRYEAVTDHETDHEAPRKPRKRREAYTDDETDHYKYDPPRKSRRPQRAMDSEVDERPSYEQRHVSKDRRKKGRIVSGAIVEEGRAMPGMRGGAGSNHNSYDSYDSILNEKEGFLKPRPPTNKKKKRCKCPNAGADDHKKSNLNDVPKDSIPPASRGTYLDPFTWADTSDFNLTFTKETVGDLPIMGLFTEWDDSASANDKVPALDKPWGDYTKRPARGVNLGGWLSLEPFITPSLFNYDSRLNIVDEGSLCSHLGPKTCAATLEKHYANFVTEQTIKDIVDAGLDHVRIPYSYWAVITYDDDPYVFRTSWRYLLRAIEWCRKYGLRVKLDLHALPGSQNGWNHSGRLGDIRWLNGTDGTMNRQRSLDVHDRLSKFFAQDRYKNVIAFYGLANEPRMVNLPADAVVSWTSDAYRVVRGNGFSNQIVFGDGFMGLANWQGKLQGLDGLVLDVHQYVIFNRDQIVYTHQKKVQYACDGWTEQTQLSMNRATGFGPTMFGEWSQADTDCAKHVTNVGWGNRWTGTCSCDQANADPSRYSDTYKKFLKMFAEAQMVSFEKGLGWWYWTWDTEDAPLWSYKKGLAAGILPAKAYDKEFKCDTDVPDFAGLPETY
ncbi:beta-glucosidase 6 [Apiospora aurea]|uniref:glucan 1,3-beta-glucosidase n=1 Tax=Apiospora aurea TaxID=335848 RepID=A0ABR1PZA3_9PEZI